jgi:hypothetical protein
VLSLRDGDEVGIEVEAVHRESGGGEMFGVFTCAAGDIEHRPALWIQPPQQRGNPRRLGRVVLLGRVNEVVVLGGGGEHGTPLTPPLLEHPREQVSAGVCRIPRVVVDAWKFGVLHVRSNRFQRGKHVP